MFQQSLSKPTEKLNTTSYYVGHPNYHWSLRAKHSAAWQSIYYNSIEPLHLLIHSAVHPLPAVIAMHNFNKEQALKMIASTFCDKIQIGVVFNNYNPVDAVLKLHEEKMELYE